MSSYTLLAKQRFGYMTHHQFAPAPSPITTFSADKFLLEMYMHHTFLPETLHL